MRKAQILLISVLSVACGVVFYICHDSLMGFDSTVLLKAYFENNSPFAEYHKRHVFGSPKYPVDSFYAYINKSPVKYNFTRSELERKFRVRRDGSDVIVFLRVQKTGTSTLTNHLSANISLPWCQCTIKDPKCPCYMEWKSKVLFKRHNGEYPCGLHADWTYLQDCVEGVMNRRHHRTIKQRHLYITMVRDPYPRFISEYITIAHGSLLNNVPLKCGGNSATKQQMPPCHPRTGWTGVSLEDFMACPSNLGYNRQTRMLADLRLVNCYNTSGVSYDERHFRMLESAKYNLENMAFFGITDYQELSQLLFEHTFDIHFSGTFQNRPQKAGTMRDDLPEETRNKITYLNRFDVMLFQFARDLFLQRVLNMIENTFDESLKNRLMSLVEPLLQHH